ncbi:MAG: hypothetical protein GEU82_06690 [Luteitalea sp.]|nr:hypothetical protein [Luteitalea sp.]
MTSYRRWLVAVAVGVSAIAAVPALRAQSNEVTNNFKYISGQDVQPVFEGWSRNPDGSFDMHFGYLNRNYVEEPSIPVGPNNAVEPGGPDRGQPTVFRPRTNRNLFTVPVPQDWGKKELIWTLTVNGKTQKAYGWLQPEWEIDPAGGANLGGRNDPELKANKPPSVVVKTDPSVAIPNTLTLTAVFTDDGLPKPAAARKAAIGQETPLLLQGGVADVPVNVPQVATGSRRRDPNAPRVVQGPTVSWMVWRGPASATFEPRTGPLKDGQAQTVATFSKPGDYVLRAIASDRALTGIHDVTVTVSSGATSSRP